MAQHCFQVKVSTTKGDSPYSNGEIKTIHILRSFFSVSKALILIYIVHDIESIEGFE